MLTLTVAVKQQHCEVEGVFLQVEVAVDAAHPYHQDFPHVLINLGMQVQVGLLHVALVLPIQQIEAVLGGVVAQFRNSIEPLRTKVALWGLLRRVVGSRSGAGGLGGVADVGGGVVGAKGLLAFHHGVLDFKCLISNDEKGLSAILTP